MEIEITINAVDAEAAARFWSVALGYREISRRLPYLVLAHPDEFTSAGLPRVLIQQVDRHQEVGTRTHLDLRVADPQELVDQLVSLGGQVLDLVDERAVGGSRWWVLRDPEGTVFCVCPGRALATPG